MNRFVGSNGAKCWPVIAIVVRSTCVNLVVAKCRGCTTAANVASLLMPNDKGSSGRSTIDTTPPARELHAQSRFGFLVRSNQRSCTESYEDPTNWYGNPANTFGDVDGVCVKLIVCPAILIGYVPTPGS